MNALRWIVVLLVPAIAADAWAQRVLPIDDATEQTVQRLIEQLDSPRFSERMRATTNLQRLGSAAVKPLEKVVLGGSSEAAGRGLGILHSHSKSDDPQLATTAREALQRIAESDGPSAPLAQRILTPPQSASGSKGTRPVAVPMPAVPVNQRIQVQIKSVNGQREIKVNENGREYRFSDLGDGLAVERPDGKGGLKKDRYKSKEELKEKDPAAYEIYKRYAGQGNGIQLQIGGPFGRGFPNLQIQPRIEIRPRRTIPQLRRPDAIPRPAPPKPAPTPKLDNKIEV